MQLNVIETGCHTNLFCYDEARSDFSLAERLKAAEEFEFSLEVFLGI